MAKGLSYMHNRDPDRPAFHRDIKAANVALTEAFVSKIIDCGLAKYVPESSAGGKSLNIATGALVGTKGYICPKYCQSARMAYNAKCEVFSFGILLLELVSGHLQGSQQDADGEEIGLEEMLDEEGEEGIVPETGPRTPLRGCSVWRKSAWRPTKGALTAW